MIRRVIRIVEPHAQNPLSLTVPALLECLNKAGVITINRDDDDGWCFDIHQPAAGKLDNRNWAHMNAERISSYGINAVSAPEYDD